MNYVVIIIKLIMMQILFSQLSSTNQSPSVVRAMHRGHKISNIGESLSDGEIIPSKYVKKRRSSKRGFLFAMLS